MKIFLDIEVYLTKLLQNGLLEMVLLFVHRDGEWSLCVRKFTLPSSVIFNRYRFYGPTLLGNLSSLRSIFNYVYRSYVSNRRIPTDLIFDTTWLSRIKIVRRLLMNDISLK